MSKNMDAFLKGNVTASDVSVLFTKWVGLSWQDICRDLKETVLRSYVKCGFTLNIDGNRDSDINIEGLQNYEIGKSNDIDMGFTLWNRIRKTFPTPPLRIIITQLKFSFYILFVMQCLLLCNANHVYDVYT